MAKLAALTEAEGELSESIKVNVMDDHLRHAVVASHLTAVNVKSSQNDNHKAVMAPRRHPLHAL